MRALAGCMRGWPGRATFILELSALCGAQPRLAAACLVERATLPIREAEVNPFLCARPNSMVTPPPPEAHAGVVSYSLLLKLTEPISPFALLI